MPDKSLSIKSNYMHKITFSIFVLILPCMCSYSQVQVRLSNGTAFSPATTWTDIPYYGTHGTHFADVNGDGKADAIVVNDSQITVRISTGNGFLPNAAWTWDPYYGDMAGGTYFADVNGDGKADAIVINHTGIAVRLSDGTKFVPVITFWTKEAYFGEKGTFFDDVNGDGKADAIVVNNAGITVRLSDGKKFGSPQVWTEGPYFGDKGISFADVNGDGKADAIVVNNTGVAVRLSDGTKFLPPRLWTQGAYYGSYGPYNSSFFSPVLFYDVNGDGKADAIVYSNAGVVVRISDGTRFVPNATWINGVFCGDLKDTFARPYTYFQYLYFADVNGDRKADAITVK